MTGRKKIEAAFSDNGTPEIPAVICYEGIYIRDHWQELTDLPWWYQHSPDIEQQMAWHRDVIAKTGQDWFVLPFFHSREYRKRLSIEVRRDGVFEIDKVTNHQRRLTEPQIAGWSKSGGLHSV